MPQTYPGGSRTLDRQHVGALEQIGPCSWRPRSPRRRPSPASLFCPHTSTFMPRPLPPAATSAPMWAEPEVASVEPRNGCDSVQGHCPRALRSASSATCGARRRSAPGSVRPGPPASCSRRSKPECRARSQAAKSIILRIASDQRDELELRQPLAAARARTQLARGSTPPRRRPSGDRQAHRDRARARDSASTSWWRDQREARKLIDHVLVVVGDDDFHRMEIPTLQLSFRGEPSNP